MESKGLVIIYNNDINEVELLQETLITIIWIWLLQSDIVYEVILVLILEITINLKRKMIKNKEPRYGKYSIFL